jgi:hypothetical protein
LAVAGRGEQSTALIEARFQLNHGWFGFVQLLLKDTCHRTGAGEGGDRTDESDLPFLHSTLFIESFAGEDFPAEGVFRALESGREQSRALREFFCG